MRSYFKVNYVASQNKLTPTVIPGDPPVFRAILHEKHKSTLCGKYNLISGASFGGQSWFLINGATQFDPVVISFTTAQLANQLWTIVTYPNHPKN